MKRNLAIQVPLLLDAATEGSPRRLRIPTLREANFVAGRYGPLTFDTPFLEALIRNFNDGVLGVDVSIDAAHRPELGALAWVKELTYANRSVTAECEPTPQGIELVEQKVYKYASAEINPDYEDRETGKKYGPVLQGIAMTNRPYVHRQEAITLLSLDDHYRVMEMGDMPGGVSAGVNLTQRVLARLRTELAARNAPMAVRALRRLKNQ